MCVFWPKLLSLGSSVAAFQIRDLTLFCVPVLVKQKFCRSCPLEILRALSRLTESSVIVISTNCPVCSGAWFQRVNDMCAQLSKAVLLSSGKAACQISSANERIYNHKTHTVIVTDSTIFRRSKKKKVIYSKRVRAMKLIQLVW